MGSPAIEIADLGVRHDGRWVLEGFSLQVARGERVTLTGPSASGKSTVLRCVLGLVIPQTGHVRILGRPLDGARVWEIRRQLAYVAQEPDLGSGTAREALHRPLAYRANAHLRGRTERVPGLLSRFGLPESVLDKEMGTLSGGEKQRIALVSAMLLERPIVLLDEASSALDTDNRRALAACLQEARDLTVLSVSHDTEWLASSHRVVELAGSAGR